MSSADASLVETAPPPPPHVRGVRNSKLNSPLAASSFTVEPTTSEAHERPDCESRTAASFAAEDNASSEVAGSKPGRTGRRCTVIVVAAPVEAIILRKSPAKSKTSGLCVFDSFTNDGGSANANSGEDGGEAAIAAVEEEAASMSPVRIM